MSTSEELRKQLFKQATGTDLTPELEQWIKDIMIRLEAHHDGDSEKAGPIGQLFKDFTSFLGWLLDQPEIKKVVNREDTGTFMGVLKKKWRLKYGREVYLLTDHPTAGIVVDPQTLIQLPVGETVIVSGRTGTKIGPYKAMLGVRDPTHTRFPIYAVKPATRQDAKIVDRVLLPATVFYNLVESGEHSTAGRVITLAQPPYTDKLADYYPGVVEARLSDPLVSPGLSIIYKTLTVHRSEIDFSQTREQIIQQIADLAYNDSPEIQSTVHVCIQKIYDSDWQNNFESSLESLLQQKAGSDVELADDPLQCIQSKLDQAGENDVLVLVSAPHPDILYGYVHLLEPGSETFYKAYKLSLLEYVYPGEYPFNTVYEIRGEESNILEKLYVPAKYLNDAGIVPVDIGSIISHDYYEVWAKLTVAETTYLANHYYTAKRLHWSPYINTGLEVPKQ